MTKVDLKTLEGSRDQNLREGGGSLSATPVQSRVKLAVQMEKLMDNTNRESLLQLKTWKRTDR